MAINLFGNFKLPDCAENIISGRDYGFRTSDRLRQEYDLWWDDISSRFNENTPLYIGTEYLNPVQLNSHEKGDRNKPLTEEQKANNIEKSRTRARV